LHAHLHGLQSIAFTLYRYIRSGGARSFKMAASHLFPRSITFTSKISYRYKRGRGQNFQAWRPLTWPPGHHLHRHTRIFRPGQHSPGRQSIAVTLMMSYTVNT
jgi:hypothetical protein